MILSAMGKLLAGHFGIDDRKTVSLEGSFKQARLETCRPAPTTHPNGANRKAGKMFRARQEKARLPNYFWIAAQGANRLCSLDDPIYSEQHEPADDRDNETAKIKAANVAIAKLHRDEPANNGADDADDGCDDDPARVVARHEKPPPTVEFFPSPMISLPSQTICAFLGAPRAAMVEN